MANNRIIALLSLILILAAADHARAQKGKDFRNVHINGGPEVAFPVNSFAETHNMAVGGSLQLAIPFAFRFFLLAMQAITGIGARGEMTPCKSYPTASAPACA